LDNPIPFGQEGTVGVWTVQVVGFSANADAAIASENSYNDKPGPDQQYAMVTVRVTYTGSGSGNVYGNLHLSAIPSDGNSVTDASGIFPNGLNVSPSLPNGVSTVGNVAFLVSKSEAGNLVLYAEDWSSLPSPVGPFFALH
jgi:hypothetical protein